MILDINLLPKKLNDINYFKKNENGCEIYSYSTKAEERNEVIVVSLNGCEIEKDFCIDSKAIDMVKVLYPCEINVTDKSFIIKSNKGKFTAKLLNEQLFNLSQNEFTNEISINIDVLVKASGYVSKNDKKPVLCGVRIDDNCNIYATDSYRAYFYKEKELTSNGITIPVNFINLIKNFNINNNLKLYYNNNILMVIINDNIKIYGRLLDGNYPDMSRIIAKKDSSTIVEIDRDEIIERLDIAYNVGSDNDKRTIVKFTNNTIEALGDNNYVAEIKFETTHEYYLKLQLDYIDQAFKTIAGNLAFKVVYDDNQKMGIMAFVENEKETCLILAIK